MDEPKSDKQTLTFARPIYSKELFDDDTSTKFDKLPAWQRHLIKRVIDHGDLKRASIEAGVSRHVQEQVDFGHAAEKSIRQALLDGGITSDVIVAHLLELLEAKVLKFDQNKNPIHCVDHVLKLKTIELIAKMRGDLSSPSFTKTQDTQKMTNKEVLDLFQETDPDK